MLSDVLGQSEVARKFLNAWRAGRLAQAYILSGPDGIGKMLFAMALVKTLLCEKQGDDACERCASCRKMAHGNHEGLEILEPTGAGVVIKYDDVNGLIERLQYKLRAGEHRFVVLREADRVMQETANHFLKTLEEPPPNVTFFLLTARLPSLLPTIISRCQTVRMHRARPDEIESFLLARGFDAAKAKLYARLADGCPGRAVNMDEAGVFERRESVLQRLLDANRDNEAVLAGEMLEANREKTLTLTRASLNVELGLMAALLRDMTLLAEGAGGPLLYNPDAEDKLGARAERFSPRKLRELTLDVLEARTNIERNIHPDFVIGRLFTELAG